MSVFMFTNGFHNSSSVFAFFQELKLKEQVFFLHCKAHSQHTYTRGLRFTYHTVENLI